MNLDSLDERDRETVLKILAFSPEVYDSFLASLSPEALAYLDVILAKVAE